MKKALVTLALLASMTVNSSELLIGSGSSFRADFQGEKFYSLTLQEGDWKYNISHWESYYRSPWDTSANPTWGNALIPTHSVFSITKTIYKYQFSENFNFYIDFGLAHTDRLSRGLSSSLLFKENFGFTYNNINLYWTHSSNAGLKSPNTGEDGIGLQWSIEL